MSCITCGKSIKTLWGLPGLCIACAGGRAPDCINPAVDGVTVIIYDSNPQGGDFDGVLRASWAGTSDIASGVRGITVAAGRGGFNAAIEQAACQLNGRRIREIQFWCHGDNSEWDRGQAKGEALGIRCGGNRTAIERLDFSPVYDQFTSEGGIWFRACGQAGSPAYPNNRAMAQVCKNAGCRYVSAHMAVIGRRFDGDENTLRGQAHNYVNLSQNQPAMYLYSARNGGFYGPVEAGCSPLNSTQDYFHQVM